MTPDPFSEPLTEMPYPNLKLEPNHKPKLAGGSRFKFKNRD